MQKSVFGWRVILVLMVAMLLGYVVAHMVTAERLEDEISAALLDSTEQLTTVAALSEVLSLGGADAVTDSVIKDCPANERTRFDTLLGRLDTGLSVVELQELSRLFDRCAAFYARRKAVMVARFEREVEFYDQFIDRYLRLSGEEAAAKFAVAEWQELARFEKDQSRHFDRLVALQGEIIATLLSGKLVTSPELTDLLREVQDVQQMQAYNTIKMSEIRTSLPTSI